MDFSQLPTFASTALTKLNTEGYEAYLVGGCVRDILRGVTPHDYDITTSATPQQIKETFSSYRTIDTGIKHGTVTVLIDGEALEITTYRTDGEYSDHRHPESVAFTKSLTEDLARRDFTCNAVAYNPINGLRDPFGGCNDIKNGIIRCVGDPYKRFDEDALRIMRALRFSATLGWKIEENTHKAILDLCSDVKIVSSERIRSELLKLICGKDVLSVLMDYSKVICKVIPELSKCVGFDQKSIHHIYTVYEHIAHVVEKTPAVPNIRFAALLHDVAKPVCVTEDDEGHRHFPNHGKIGADMAEQICKRLKFANKDITYVYTLVLHHDDYPHRSRASVRKDIACLGSVDIWRDMIDLRIADSRAKAPQAYGNEQLYYDTVISFARDIIADGDCVFPEQLDLTGEELLARGYKGKAIGEALKSAYKKVLSGEIENEKNALIEYILSANN